MFGGGGNTREMFTPISLKKVAGKSGWLGKCGVVGQGI